MEQNIKNNKEKIYTSTFNITNIILGILIGIILSFAIFWLLYDSRSFLFKYCPNQTRRCMENDYINNPSGAILKEEDIKTYLSVSNGKLIYKRKKKEYECIPYEQDQNVQILYPMYCEYNNNGSTATEIFKQTFYNSNVYQSLSDPNIVIKTSGNCIPVGIEYDNVSPSINWDVGQADNY